MVHNSESGNEKEMHRKNPFVFFRIQCHHKNLAAKDANDSTDNEHIGSSRSNSESVNEKKIHEGGHDDYSKNHYHHKLKAKDASHITDDEHNCSNRSKLGSGNRKKMHLKGSFDIYKDQCHCKDL